ncbi:MAG: hypothetical protein HY423_05095 [Candidatus Lambdaproteobacteria bacterium]|nr:hypothetical protein [Candidatus Lambdaproteobacteria bacterium]
MKGGNLITLFPFLSVLTSAMGVLSLLAVIFVWFARTQSAPGEATRPAVDVQWIGAPSHVRPLLVECRGDGLVLHYRAGTSVRRFSRAALRKEAEVLKDLIQQALGQLGPAAGRQELWRQTVSLMRNERRLAESFAMAMYEIELDNIEAQSRTVIRTRYPILLVYPDGIEVHELVSYIIENATRLPVGLEPMLDGWGLPYLKFAS